jgi:hypothetical protein
MAEPYSDEELRAWLVRLGTTAEIGYGDMRVIGAVRRLLAERDKARRVAKVLAGPAKHLKVLGHDLTADELKAIDTALAYPGREP